MAPTTTAGDGLDAAPVGVLSRAVSAWNILLLGVCGLGVAVASYANVDADIYWHRILGARWLSQLGFGLTPDPIAYTPGTRTWFPTAWVPEVLYAEVVDHVGYDGILWLRGALAVAFFGFLAAYLLRHVDAWLAAVLAAMVGLPAAVVLQDRPQTISLVFCAAALPTMHRWLFDDRVPRLVPAVLVTWGWANIHGLWVLVPAFFALTALVDLLDRNPRWRRGAVSAAACVAAAGLTPVGPRLLLSPIVVSQSAQQISEWQATAFRSPVAWGFAATLVVLFLCLASSSRVDRRTIVTVTALAVFGFMAYRNAVVASLLLLPITAHQLGHRFRDVRSHLVLPAVVVWALGAVVAVGLAVQYAGQSVAPDWEPAHIAARLATYGPVHVVTPYNESGYLREFGGPDVRVAIDGRADRYGNARIRKYIDMTLGLGSWRTRLAALHPDVVVIQRASPLDDLLLADGWREVMRDHGFVLLAPPGSRLPGS